MKEFLIFFLHPAFLWLFILNHSFLILCYWLMRHLLWIWLKKISSITGLRKYRCQKTGRLIKSLWTVVEWKYAHIEACQLPFVSNYGKWYHFEKPAVSVKLPAPFKVPDFNAYILVLTVYKAWCMKPSRFVYQGIWLLKWGCPDDYWKYGRAGKGAYILHGWRYSISCAFSEATYALRLFQATICSGMLA